MNQVLESRFKASMLGLIPGDLIIAKRNNAQLYSVVLERNEKYGRLFFKLSRFSTLLNTEEYPKDVFWDDICAGLSDSSGTMVLFCEEWKSTEKDGAKTLLEKRPEKKPESAKDKAKEIFESIRDGRKSIVRNAEDILKKIGYDSPSREQVMLLAFALKCAADRVWEL